MKIEKSFTLMEVVVATLVMVVIIAGLSYGVSLYPRSVNSVHQRDIAIYAAQDKLEEIANNIENVLSYNGHTFNVTDSNGKNILTLSSGVSPGSVVVVRNSDISSLYNVVVTIAWDNSGQQSLALNTAFIQK